MPLIAGLTSAIAVPWVTLFGASIAKFPRAFLHKVQFLEASKRRIVEYHQRAEEESAIAQLEAAKEHRQIEAAKRLEEAEEVSPELKSEIEEERKSSPDQVVPSLLGDLDVTLLTFASVLQSGSFYVERGSLYEVTEESPAKHLDFGKNHRKIKLLEESLTHLSSNLLLERSPYSGDLMQYEILTAGYDALEPYRP